MQEDTKNPMVKHLQHAASLYDALLCGLKGGGAALRTFPCLQTILNACCDSKPVYLGVIGPNICYP